VTPVVGRVISAGKLVFKVVRFVVMVLVSYKLDIVVVIHFG
jgi:hypothetical protein